MDLIAANLKWKWLPTTLPITAQSLAASPILVVHYWADWNPIDREMDNHITALQPNFAGQITFRSCNIDLPENTPFIHNVANIPALGIFRHGEHEKTNIGLLSQPNLRSLLTSLTSPDIPPARKSPLHLGRKLFTLLAALSLLFCITTTTLWLHNRNSNITHFNFLKRNLPNFGPVSSLQLRFRNGQVIFVYLGNPALPLASLPNPPTTETYLRRLNLRLQAGYWQLIPDTTTTPYRITLVFPAWYLSLATAILPTTWLLLTLRTRHRQKAGHCPTCNYDLRASPTRCPECGHTVHTHQFATPP